MRTPGHDVTRRPRVVVRPGVLAAVATGGALGSLTRWAVGEVPVPGGGDFPWATFTVNVSGAFALGLFMVLVLEVLPPSRYLRPFLGVGVLGGYTTFSTYALDTRTLLADGRVGLAATYLFGTLVLGLAAVWAGAVCGRATVTRHVRRRR